MSDYAAEYMALQRSFLDVVKQRDNYKAENARLIKERDEAVELLARLMDAEGLEAEAVMEDMADFLKRLEE